MSPTVNLTLSKQRYSLNAIIKNAFKIFFLNHQTALQYTGKTTYFRNFLCSELFALSKQDQKSRQTRGCGLKGLNGCFLGIQVLS